MNNQLDFENMGIYDLRNYARNIGVVSPTKFKRDVLIQKITAIIMGQEPEKKKTNKGRPPKHKINEQSRLDFILPNNMFDNNNPMYKSFENYNFNTVKKGDMFCENSNSTQTNVLFDGYYVPYDANYGFVLKQGYLTNYYKENVIILNELANQYNLQEGDYVKGACSQVENKKLMLATKLVSVNFTELDEDNKRKKPENTKITKPTEKIKLYNNGLIDFTIIDKLCPIVKGTRVLLTFKDKDVIKNTMISMLNNMFEINNIKTFLFSIDDLPEEVYDIAYNCPNLELVNYNFNMEMQNYFDMLKLKIKHIQRLLQEGYDVAIVCYNAQNLKNNYATNKIIIENISKDSAMEFAQNKLKDLFCMARNTEKGSLTTIFIDENQTFVDICNTFVCFNAQKLLNTDITVDIFKSFTRNMQDLIDKTQMEKLKQFKLNLTEQNILDRLDTLFKD